MDDIPRWGVRGEVIGLGAGRTGVAISRPWPAAAVAMIFEHLYVQPGPSFCLKAKKASSSNEQGMFLNVLMKFRALLTDRVAIMFIRTRLA